MARSPFGRGAGAGGPGMQRVPLVKPPRTSQGGGAARPFGAGSPGLPRPGTRRARDLARQWNDDARGRFTERLFTFADSVVVAPGTTTDPGSTIDVVSNRGDFLRMVALRGSIVATSGAQVSTDLTNIRLSLTINGEEFFATDGKKEGFASYADMFTTNAPWFWYASPPRLRVGDVLRANWQNTNGGGGNSITASLVARLVDDQWWRALYGDGAVTE